MQNNRFSVRLKSLMRERKISGQKIAAEVGVSQKTISRYATGQNEANENMQKKILEAIAKIGGHPEDAIVNISFSNINETLEILETTNLHLASDDKIFELEFQEFYRDKKIACIVFSLLEEENQKFVLEHFDVYCEMDTYEIAILEVFSLVSEEERNFILDSLETVHFSFSAVMSHSDICRKIVRYMEMIPRCKALKLENMEKFKDIPEDICLSNYVQEYADKLERSNGFQVEKMKRFLSELITLNEKDWYFLILVQILGLKDRGANTTYDGKIVGDKVYALICYMERKRMKKQSEEQNI